MSLDSNQPNPSNTPINSLAARMLDTELTEAERAELMSRLRDNAAELDEYVDQLVLHALLRKEIGAGGTPCFAEDVSNTAPICPPLDQPSIAFPPETRGWAGNTWQSVLFFALGLLVAISVMSWWSLQTAKPQLPLAARSPSPSPITPVAYLTSTNGCAWGGGSVKAWTVGHSVESGSEISLHEGIAEFRLANGVALSLEGPASLILASPTTLVLQYGKLTLNVRWNVTDFKVIAGACRFTACDSEFGLLQTGNKVELHVFSGAVHAESPSVLDEAGGADFFDGGMLVIDDAGQFTRGTITAGNALTLVSEGDSLAVDGKMGQKAKPESFATKLSMAGPLPVTKGYVDAVLASKPLGYWRFESLEDGKIKSEVAGGGDLTMLGDLRFTGQPENYAVEFHPNLVGRFKSKALNQLAGSDYSLEAWIKPSHAHRGNIFALSQYVSGESRAAAVLSLFAGVDRRQKNPVGAIGMMHESFEDLGMQGNRKVVCFSKRPYQARRWQHVVAVKKGSQLQLFLDGKLSNSVADPTSLTTGFHLSVGRDPGNRECRFVGQLDEVAVYSRALTGQEILQHYELIKGAVDAPVGSPSIPAGIRPNRSARFSPAPTPQFTPSLVSGFATL